MNVLADFHHEELHESLRILFEDRLHFNLYKQIGEEWHTNNYWHLSDHPYAIKQHLQLGGNNSLLNFTDKNARFAGDAIRQKGGRTHRYVNYDGREISPGVFVMKNDMFPDTSYKGITFEAFKNTKFDILVCTFPYNIPAFFDLKAKYNPNAKIIFQIGNNWHPPAEVKNVLCSSRLSQLDPSQNSVFYHQEFSMNRFTYNVSKCCKSMNSFMHCPQDLSSFYDLESSLLGWQCRAYGLFARDGIAGPSIEEIAELFIHKTSFLWHVKPEGEGYGYNIHRAIACGIPVITKRIYLQGSTADMLLEDGVSCIDLDKHSIQEAVLLITKMHSEYEKYSEQTYRKFNTVVNFDNEFESIKKFIERLS